MKKFASDEMPPVMKEFTNRMMSVTHILFSQYEKEEMKMKVKHVLNKLLLIFFAVIVGSSSAYAIPTLQLDIQGGRYDALDQTIFATGSSFALYALLLPDKGGNITDTYYISAALRPKTGPSGGDFGSFTFGGETVRATADMSYGIPPLELYLGKDPGDLSRHGIFETYFTEFSFTFSGSNMTQAYNSQDYAGQGPKPYSSGDKMYYQSFLVDTSLLAAGYSIHFDLYNEKFGKGTDIDVKTFAPFSHDANSTTSVPEPATILLLGLGLIGLVGARRINESRRGKRSGVS